jgi:hypothetical protein
MRIRTVINGKEIVGYWNGKTYKSKLGEDYIKIYIDRKEYNIRQDEFKYEELLTEKQEKFAEKIKKEFLKALKEADANEEIIKYFEAKPLKYYLDNRLVLPRFLARIEVDEKLLLSLVKGEVPYELSETTCKELNTEEAKKSSLLLSDLFREELCSW